MELNAIKSKLWVKIITSNHWKKLPGEETERMFVDPMSCFRLSLGECVFRCQDKMFGLK